MVRVPDAAAQAGRAPVKALRGFFASIGQLLAAADRFTPEESMPADVRADTQRIQGAASEQSPARRFRSLDSTGNVRLLTTDEVVSEPDEDLPLVAEPVGPADLPVADFDQVTLPSLRSRLRNLDAAQLRALADYEKVTANRPEVLGMLERRITKLQAADTHAS